MNLDMDSKILEIKNTSEVTKWTIYKHVSPSIKEAARSLNIKSGRDIIRCCKGERKSRAGYKWKYKDE